MVYLHSIVRTADRKNSGTGFQLVLAVSKADNRTHPMIPTEKRH